MGELAPIGHHGAPLRPPLRPVRPAVPVLVDLGAVFGRQPHQAGRFHPNGLQLHRVVTGLLGCWGLGEQGDWWGLVTYDVCWGARRRSVTHWVPAWTLRPGSGDFGP